MTILTQFWAGVFDPKRQKALHFVAAFILCLIAAAFANYWGKTVFVVAALSAAFLGVPVAYVRHRFFRKGE